MSLQPELVHFVAVMNEPLAACWMASAGRKGFLCLAWLLQALVAWWLAGNEGEKQWQCQHHHQRPQITCLADLCPPLHPLLPECLQRDIRQHTGVRRGCTSPISPWEKLGSQAMQKQLG